MLQTFSLHKYLLECGYDAVVLNKFGLPNEDECKYLINNIFRLRGGCRFILGCLNFSGMFCQLIKEIRLNKWLRDNIIWSVESGFNDSFPARSIRDGIIIVGSDQVWNPAYPTLAYYLLGEFSDNVVKIAFSASFGTNKFPKESVGLYKSRLEQFDAISVRESSAVGIIKDMFGLVSEHVCDPTLLHTREEWNCLLGIDKSVKTCGVMMYFVTYDFRLLWRAAVGVAWKSKKKVHCFAMVKSELVPIFNFRNPLLGVYELGKNIAKRLILFCSGVRLHFAATPTEFVKMVASCDGLVTDSFHGMMFATIYEKPLNVVIGSHPQRLQMSTRLKDFLSDFGDVSILTEVPDLTRMKVLKVTPQLGELVEKSKAWLKDAISIRRDCHE